MSIELWMLAWTLLLAVVQILAADVARTRQYGLNWNTGARDETMPELKPTVGRLLRAQANLYETLPIFAAAVLILHVTNRLNVWSLWGSQLYFWGRVVYVPLYALGIKQVRSLVWLVSFAGLLAVLGAVFLARAPVL